MIRSGCPSAPIWVYNPTVVQARKTGLNIELDNLDHRVIGEALVERVGHLIEIVGYNPNDLGTPGRIA